MLTRATFSLFACWSIVVLAGCGSSGPGTVSVTGQVTFDGRPLRSGEIIFRAEGSPSHAGKILDGRYSLDSTAGPKRVEITAVGTPTTSAAAGSGEPEIEFDVQLPPRYHSRSELTATVTEHSPNEFDFDLTP